MPVHSERGKTNLKVIIIIILNLHNNASRLLINYKCSSERNGFKTPSLHFIFFFRSRNLEEEKKTKSKWNKIARPKKCAEKKFCLHHKVTYLLWLVVEKLINWIILSASSSSSSSSSLRLFYSLAFCYE